MTDPLDGGHLDIELIADLDEGLLTPIETAAAEEHLRLCLACREDRARLSSTRAQLAALPQESMPPEVARRLQTALQGAASTVVPLDDKRRRGWRAHPTAAGLGAAAAVAALIAAVVVGAFGHSKPAPTAGPQNAERVNGSGGAAASAPTYPITATGNVYTPGRAGQLVAALITGNQPSVAQSLAPQAPSSPAPSDLLGTSSNAPVPAALTKLRTDPAALEACVRALVPPPNEPIAVDFGQYTDPNPAHHLVKKPAVVLVFANQVGANPGAWIVGPGCATAPDNNFYLFEVVPNGG